MRSLSDWATPHRVKAALQWAAQQAQSTGAVLRAVHVLGWPYGLSSAGFPSPMDVTNVTPDELQDSYRETITTVFEAVSPDPSWILQFASGDARQVLVRQSQDARLLVVGTREHVGLGRLLTGSVSHYCLSHAACPVVAVPAPISDRLTLIEGAKDEAEEPQPTHKTLVVVIDASAESLAAARYAVAAAEMRRADVLLVHVFPQPPGRAGDMAYAAAQAAAERLLAAVATQLIVPPHLRLFMRPEPGDAVSVLTQSGASGAMLVVGRDRVSWGERLFMGAVASQVASSAACPLVVVPSSWVARHAWPPHPVVVAPDGETAAEPALKVASEEARLRDTRVVVLHAEPIGASAQDVDAARFDLGVLLANWKQDHSDVAIRTVVVAGDTDAQLVRWSRSASVLVVGRPHDHRWGSWTPSVARSVMQRTHCPLIVAPRTTTESEQDRVLADRAQS